MKKFYIFRRVILFLLVCFFLSHCSTARDRTAPSFISGIENDSSDLLIDNYKTATLYVDYTTRIEIDVLFYDLLLRRLYIEDDANNYLFTDKKTTNLKNEATREYNNSFDFFVFVYSDKKVNLESEHSLWKIFLEYTDNNFIASNKSMPIDKKGKLFAFFKKYFYRADRWVELYLVSFPREKQHQNISPNKIALALRGIEGNVQVVWEDTDIFFQSRNLILKK